MDYVALGRVWMNGYLLEHQAAHVWSSVPADERQRLLQNIQVFWSDCRQCTRHGRCGIAAISERNITAGVGNEYSFHLHFRERFKACVEFAKGAVFDILMLWRRGDLGLRLGWSLCSGQ